VITYCGGGVFGAFALFALYLQGHENVALYDASWMEWEADPSLPVEPMRGLLDLADHRRAEAYSR